MVSENAHFLPIEDAIAEKRFIKYKLLKVFWIKTDNKWKYKFGIPLKVQIYWFTHKDLKNESFFYQKGIM